MEIFIQDYKQLDKIGKQEGRAVGEVVFFQGKQLTAWIKWDHYLVRWYDVLWFAGYEGDEFIYDNMSSILELFKKYIKDRPLYELANEAQEFTKNHKRYFYGKFNNLSKKQLDLLSDEDIEK